MKPPSVTRRELLGAAALGAFAGLLPRALRAAPPEGTEPDPLAFVPGRPLPWHNWAGNQGCRPAARLAPQGEAEVVEAIARTTGPLRPAGSGHSFSALVPSAGTLLFVDALTGVASSDAERLQAEVYAGTRLHALGPALAAVEQASPNLPDIDYQTLGGAIATGTHGTGATLGSLSSQVVGLTLATPRGELVACDAQTRPELFHAARVSLGALGVVTRVRLQNRARHRLLERLEFVALGPALERVKELRDANLHFELMPFPHSDSTLLSTTNESDAAPSGIGEEDPYAIDLLETMFGLTRVPLIGHPLFDLALRVQPTSLRCGESYAVLAHPRIVRFREMEYTVPAEAGPDCLREVLRTIRERDIRVHWPLEYRYVRADDTWLSMFSQRNGASISVHQSAALDHRPYFDAVEPIFWKYEGRPHWGKLHTLGAARLDALYPKLRDFRALRRELDPEGRFLNDHLRAIVGA